MGVGNVNAVADCGLLPFRRIRRYGKVGLNQGIKAQPPQGTRQNRMRISRIGVYGLFDRFDHELEFRPEEPVTIMIGPNGIGKTMMLRIINALFNAPLQSLEALPFQRLEVGFDDSSELCVERKAIKRERQKSAAKFAVAAEYRNLRQPIGHIHSEDVLSGGAALDAEPKWICDIRRSTPVRFIDAERPNCFSPNGSEKTAQPLGLRSSKPTERVDALTKIVNSLFIYKNVCVGPKGLAVKDDNGSKLDFDMLSSGERRQLYILYELLFNTSENSLVMIDDPELFLHVYWQDRTLGVLYEMARLSKLNFLLATHSPHVIREGWNLVVELKGPEDK